MTANYPYSELNTPGNNSNKINRQEGRKNMLEIDARGVPYARLNEKVREAAREGYMYITLQGVKGQRYLGSRLEYPELYLQVHGIPGEDLAFNLSGPTVEVFGHGQNAVANTMDSGKVIVHGLAGDAAAYGMRGGKLFIRDDVGYRVGIHMKEYGDKIPVVVIGGSAGDFLGEYMAGGIIILLNKDNLSVGAAGLASNTLATGIHGGKLYLFGSRVPEHQLGIGAAFAEADKEEKKQVEELCREFCHDSTLTRKRC